MTIQCIICRGAPSSGKSFWAKQMISDDPLNWARINNDDLRSMVNGSVWSKDYEKLITNTRNFLIKEAFKQNKNVIIDNVNAGDHHWETICKFAKQANQDIEVSEKPFYQPLSVLLERDAQRIGAAQVGEKVVKKWFKDLGGDDFQNYVPRAATFSKNVQGLASPIRSKDFNKEDAILCDLDGTLAIVGDRSPYDASQCHLKDSPNLPVIETVLLWYKAGKKIVFCSARPEDYRWQTEAFINQYCIIDGKPIQYQLLMRKSKDYRQDSICKEEIFREHIEPHFNVIFVLDDRDSVVAKWRELGLTCFQVASGDF